MNQSLLMRYMGFMLFTGCTMATLFTVVLWFLLSFTLSEGILATAFCLSLSITGLAVYKFTPIERKIGTAEIDELYNQEQRRKWGESYG